MPYLLDPNTVIALLKGNPQVFRQLNTTPISDVFTCRHIFYEIHVGLFIKEAKRPPVETANARRRVEKLFSTIKTIEPEEKDFKKAARIRAALVLQRQEINDVDYFIAGTARARKLIVVTEDKDFGRIPRLKTMNWLE